MVGGEALPGDDTAPSSTQTFRRHCGKTTGYTAIIGCRDQKSTLGRYSALSALAAVIHASLFFWRRREYLDYGLQNDLDISQERCAAQIGQIEFEFAGLYL